MADTAINVALNAFQAVLPDLLDSGEVLTNARDWLERMKAILEDSEDEVEEGNKQFITYVTEVENVAVAIEDVLDSFLARVTRHRHQPSRFVQRKIATVLLGSRIRSIQTNQIARLPADPPAGSSSSRWSYKDVQNLTECDELVGFEKVEEQLFNELQKASLERSFVLVAGPAGSGKTALVYKLYQNDERVRAFSVREWLQASETPESSLQGEKFLVVLDDVWSKDDLIRMVKNLPTGIGGSKIVITSRNSAVTSLLPGRYAVHSLDLSGGLSFEEAENLFCTKVFPESNGNWPPHISLDTRNWAQKFLSKCEGMPLPISAMGNFLYRQKDCSPFYWHKLDVNIASELCTKGSNLYMIRSNLEPSYRGLPSHLRNCFLYFSMFPEGYEISRERLKRLWIAENFIVPGRPQVTHEWHAENYLNELVERNLVRVCNANGGHRVRSCRVLEYVRLINSSRRKGFLTISEPDYTPADKRSIRRLSACAGGIDSLKGFIGGVRSFLGSREASIREIEMVLKSSKFLRILDLEGLPDLKEIPKHVFHLILLKYLSLRKTGVEIVPKDIRKLVLLETFDLKDTKVTELPVEINSLSKLQHLLVNTSNGEGVKVSEDVGGSPGTLQKLSLIKVPNTDFIKSLGKLTLLRKLGLEDLQTTDGKELCSVLEQMKGLLTLNVRAKDKECLDLDHCANPPRFLRHLCLRGPLAGIPSWISKLSSLEKVGFYCSNLSSNPLQILQDLPYLLELKMVQYYQGEKLVFEAGKFKKLTTLILEEFDQLKSLEAEDGALPKLRELKVSKCPYLKSVPKEIRALTTIC